MRVVVDTNILVSAFLNSETAPRQIIRLCLQGKLKPLIGTALFSEYRAVLSRGELFAKCILDQTERDDLFAAFLAQSVWINIHYLWRPNLPDEADNHLIELAVAGDAESIISANIRDLKFGELLFPQIKIFTAGEFVQNRSEQWLR